MFHVKHFCDSLRGWNKIHRLIGNVSCETLLEESSSAIKSSFEELKKYRLMVDVGAGAGILGVAWLIQDKQNKVVFLEPDNKAFSFLVSFFSSDKNCRLIKGRVEDAALDDKILVALGVEKKDVFFAARAFSSSSDLATLYKKSAFKDYPLYSFEKNDTGYILSKIF